MKPGEAGYHDPELKRTGYMPKAGYVKNPMVEYPRNLPCFCASGKKFKKCCLPKLKDTVKKDEAPRLYDYLKARILVIETMRLEQSEKK